MCNRVRGVSKQILRDKFGDVIITDGGREVALDELPDRPEASFAYDTPKPKLPVLTSLNPQRWQNMQMKYLPREASGKSDLQDKLGDLHNARAETIFEKFSFKNSIRQRRCIIPLEGFYDFQGRGKKNGKEDNQCYYIDLKDGELFYAAGIWDLCDGGGRLCHHHHRCQSADARNTQQEPAPAACHRAERLGAVARPVERW